jgi:adenylate cyclase
VAGVAVSAVPRSSHDGVVSDRPEVQAAARALGSTMTELQELWRTLGLPLPSDGLGEEDLALLGLLLDVAEQVGDRHADAPAVARPLAHHVARLATGHVLGVVEGLALHHPRDQVAEAAREVMGRQLPRLERLLVELFRRHVAKVLDWQADRALEEVYDLELSVGFSDMVAYTVLSAGLQGRALAALIRTFEQVCVEVVTRYGGRIVKTLGDEVLFVTDDAATAVMIGLELGRRASTSSLLPELRVGVSTGTVTAVLGDVYGMTVNRAARLTKAAQPGEVLVDAGTQERVEHDSRVRLQPREPVVLDGFGPVRTWCAVTGDALRN